VRINRAICATCRHWQERASKYSRSGAWGDCRIAAPARAEVDGNGNKLTPGEPHWGVWPATMPSDGCGQHEAPPDALDEAPVIIAVQEGGR
jgi:hypothetical protein